MEGKKKSEKAGRSKVAAIRNHIISGSEKRETLPLFASVTIILLACGWKYLPSYTANTKSSPTSEISWNSTDFFNFESIYRLEVDDGNKPIPPYESSMLARFPNHYLPLDICKNDEFEPKVLYNMQLFHVTKPMEESTVQSNEIFFMLNGQNKGVYVSYNKNFDCINEAANVAAVALGADLNLLDNGIRLYNQMGFPIRNSNELEESRRIVHILIDLQIWVWPGIRKGYKYTLEDGIVMTTVGLAPKVFDVEYFLTQEESEKIIEIGKPTLGRSMVVDPKNGSAVSEVRTSHTAFLPDSKFVRNFQRRGTRLARLPSPSYAERLQLVRYNAGEFYRQHLDTFASREFLPKDWSVYTYQDYEDWVKEMRKRIVELGEQVPFDFREGGRYFPTVNDTSGFDIRFVDLFRRNANVSNLFVSLSDGVWDTWLKESVDKNSVGIISTLLKSENRPNYLPLMVKEWERAIDMPGLHYTFPKKRANGLSIYYYWIRWLQERIAYHGNKLSHRIQPTGDLYPLFSADFTKKLMKFVLEDYSELTLTSVTNFEWYKWIIENNNKTDAGFEVLRSFPQTVDLFIRSWEYRAQAPELRFKIPKYVKHFNPQRFVTMFFYLNNEIKVGGETVFPYSLDRFTNDTIRRTGMSECSKGLAVPPRSLHVSLFYVQTPEEDVDHMSFHGGCPPEEGTKWGSNLFMWNADAVDGASVWRK